MESHEAVKSSIFMMVGIVEYVSNAIISKTILKKTTGNVSVMALDSGEGLTENISPFDMFVQIIDGSAEILIDDKSYLLDSGQSIVIPAHSTNELKANVRFKMVSTIIKSGYE